MRDPWKLLAFPAAAVAGYILAQTSMAVFVQQYVGVSEYISRIAVVAVSGFIAGFTVDEVIPAYVEKVRGSSGGGGDLGGGDIDGDMDFGE